MNDSDRRELNFDGKGINGPSEHRARVATFRNEIEATEYGKLFEAAPEMRDALKFILVATAEWPGNMKASIQAVRDKAIRALDLTE